MGKLALVSNHMNRVENTEIALIVGAARTGTTLLRLLLDAHPEIGCPAEAGIPALVSHMARVWATALGNEVQSLAQSNLAEPQTVPRKAAPSAATAMEDRELQVDAVESAWIRQTVNGVTSGYCRPRGKRLYVDKSLDSAYYLKVMRRVYPECKIVCMVRHVLDAVSSGLEASPWGFRGYGYAPYVAATPGNTVAALAGYWLDHVTVTLEAIEASPQAACLVRYEDLVLQPRETIIRIQKFLGVTETPGIFAAAFGRSAPNGPGDYKVEFTSRIHADSIGRGKRIPVTELSEELLGAVNERLGRLGYDELTQAWNTTERPVDQLGVGIWAEQLVQIMESLRTNPPSQGSGLVALLADDHRALRWIIDLERRTVSQGDGEAEVAVIGSAKDLVLMLSEEENLGVLVRDGRIRHAVANGGASDRGALLRELQQATAAARRL